jgi:hypothetical protein
MDYNDELAMLLPVTLLTDMPHLILIIVMTNVIGEAKRNEVLLMEIKYIRL